MVTALRSQMSVQSAYFIKSTHQTSHSTETAQWWQTSIVLALYVARFPIFL